jgi:hypothetical protein
MAIVLEECTTEEQRTVVRFLWTKGLNAEDIHKEMSPVYFGQCLSRKAFHDWVEKFSEGCSKVADNAEMAETTVSMLVEDMSRKFFFSRFEYHMLYVLYPFVTYLLSFPRISHKR